MTAVANAVFTSAQFNTYVRDNLNACETGTVTAAKQIFVSTGPKALAAYTPAAATVLTSEGITQNTAGNLATVGPSVTVTTGTTAFVHIASRMEVSDATNVRATASFQVSGATTLSENDHPCQLWWDGVASGNAGAFGSWTHLTTLTPGSNTFKMVYWVSTAGYTATFADRHIIVVPL